MSEINTEQLNEVLLAQFEFVDDFILRKGAWTPETLESWREQLGNDIQSIESVINHIHIQSLFWLSENEELSIPDMLKVGSQVQTAWESILASNFPNKQFKVIFNDHVTSDGWVGDMHVTAYQIAKNA